MRDFNSLSEQEILALAVSLEEEDERDERRFGVRQLTGAFFPRACSRRCRQSRAASWPDKCSGKPPHSKLWSYGSMPKGTWLVSVPPGVTT